MRGGRERRIAGLALLPAACLALAACAAEGEADGPDATGAQDVVDITEQQGSVEEFVGALEDAETDRCEAAEGGWVGEGTVTNPTGAAQSYRLYVAFTENGDTRGLVQVDVESVPAGESAPWRAEADLSGDGLQCVLRVERFDPQ